MPGRLAVEVAKQRFVRQRVDGLGQLAGACVVEELCLAVVGVSHDAIRIDDGGADPIAIVLRADARRAGRTKLGAPRKCVGEIGTHATFGCRSGASTRGSTGDVRGARIAGRRLDTVCLGRLGQETGGGAAYGFGRRAERIESALRDGSVSPCEVSLAQSVSGLPPP